MWSQFEAFDSGLEELAKEDWISFRTRYYAFEEFLTHWFDRIRSEEKTSMSVRLQKEIDKYKVIWEWVITFATLTEKFVKIGSMLCELN